MRSRWRCARWASGAGDEVVVPSFTFYASAEAIPPTGARPVFCDVDPETFCVTADTRARGADAAHEGGDRGAPVRQRGAGGGDRGARGAGARGRGAGGRLARRWGAAGGAGDGGDVLVLPVQEPRGRSGTAARSRRATTGSPSGCGCCASTARATSRRSSWWATTRGWTSCRRRSCACSCRTWTAGRPGAAAAAAHYEAQGLGELVDLPRAVGSSRRGICTWSATRARTSWRRR